MNKNVNGFSGKNKEPNRIPPTTIDMMIEKVKTCISFFSINSRVASSASASEDSDGESLKVARRQINNAEIETTPNICRGHPNSNQPKLATIGIATQTSDGTISHANMNEVPVLGCKAG